MVWARQISITITTYVKISMSNSKNLHSRNECFQTEVLSHVLIRSGYLPYFCIGFLALKKSTKTIKLLKEWNNADIKIDASNQLTFQRAVIMTNANGRVLPVTHFPNGEIFFEQMPKQSRNQVVVIHNNFIIGLHKKIQRFTYFNLWAPNLEPGK